jgi:hypothetical protein
MKYRNNLIIQAEENVKNNALDIHINIGGEKRYIYTHRYNRLIFQELKCGVTIGKLKRFKPGCSRAAQKYYRSIRHLLKIIHEYLIYDLTA